LTCDIAITLVAGWQKERNRYAQTPRTPRHGTLIEAAAREFNTAGFHGTNTNLIARAAGFAPQTFYRHFEDKIDVFVAAYEYWQAREREAVSRALGADAPHRAIAKAALDHHL
jgi:AcrR family transcriptional regulator